MHGVRGTHSIASLRPCISIGYTGSSSSGGGSTPTPAKPGRTIADGTYFIRNMNSGKYLDVLGSGTVNKSSVEQYDFTGYKNQQWRITYESDGYYRISPVHASSKALDMQSESSSRQDGTSAWIYDYKPTVQEQKWIIKTATGGGYEFITKPSSSTSAPKALEIANSSKANGAKAQIWTSSTSRTSDNWTLIPVYSRSAEVFQSARKPKFEEDGKLARDFHTGDKSLEALGNINGSLKNLAKLYNGESVFGHSTSGPQALHNYMFSLAYLFTTGDSSMHPVIRDMVSNFLYGSGKDFRDNRLTQKAVSHSSTQQYIQATKKTIITYLKKNPGNPADLKTNSYFDRAMKGIKLPQYAEAADFLNGLKICINGTWGAKIEIKDYEYDGLHFKGTIRYTIYDHFGLDDGDVTGSGWYSYFLSYTNQFGSWYVLQRYIGCNNKYKPFVTYIETDISFEG